MYEWEEKRPCSNCFPPSFLLYTPLQNTQRDSRLFLHLAKFTACLHNASWHSTQLTCSRPVPLNVPFFGAPIQQQGSCTLLVFFLKRFLKVWPSLPACLAVVYYYLLLTPSFFFAARQGSMPIWTEPLAPEAARARLGLALAHLWSLHPQRRPPQPHEPQPRPRAPRPQPQPRPQLPKQRPR